MVVEVLIAHPPQVYKYTMWVQAIMTAHLIGGKSPRNPEGDGADRCSSAYRTLLR